MKNTLETVKNYISIIVLIPLILGGLWQAYSLISISTSYLRFFSVTQQVADGILLLYFFGIFSTIFYVYKTVFFDKIINKDRSKDESNRTLILRILSALFATIITPLFFSDIIISVLHGKAPLHYIAMFAIFTAIIAIVSLSFCLDLAFLLKKIMFNSPTSINPLVSVNSSVSTNSNFSHIINIVMLMIGFFALISLLVKFFTFFDSTYSMPSNLKNSTYVLNKYYLENKSNRDSIKILYMNDKYIFIKDSANVEIVKLDYMFKSNDK